VGSVMIGYEGHRGWINYLAVDPSLRRQGIGRRLMEHAEEILRRAGCPKINLQVRSENMQAADFYADLGYLRDDVISFSKRLDPD
jgi:ribosomal protein S18 acetylase RimI-like enzyme